MDAERFVCTLDVNAAEGRQGQVEELAQRIVERERHGARSAAVVVTRDAEALLRAFVRDEARCCPFFDFAVERNDRGVRLAVTAPAGAEPLLDALLAVLDPDSSATLPGSFGAPGAD